MKYFILITVLIFASVLFVAGLESGFYPNNNVAASIEVANEEMRELGQLKRSLDVLIGDIENIKVVEGTDESKNTSSKSTLNLVSEIDKNNIQFKEVDVFSKDEAVAKIVIKGNGKVTYAGTEGLDGRPFGYKGGEYPGVGGTCGEVIEKDCTIVLEYIAKDVKDLKRADSWLSSRFSINYIDESGETKKTPVLSMYAWVNKPGEIVYTKREGFPFRPVLAGTYAKKIIDFHILTSTTGKPIPVKILEVSSLKSPFKDVTHTCNERKCEVEFAIDTNVPGDYSDKLAITYDNGYEIRKTEFPVEVPVYSGSYMDATPEENILVVYNKSVPESVEIKDYYLANRPGFSKVNVLGINYSAKDFEVIFGSQVKKTIVDPIYNWIKENKDKKIRHIVLVRGLPMRVDEGNGWYFTPSLGWYISRAYATRGECDNYYLSEYRNYGDYRQNEKCDRQPAKGVNSQPYLNYIFSPETHPGTLAISTFLDMGSKEATIAYIDKLKAMHERMPSPSVFISAKGTGKQGSTYYLEDAGGYKEGWAYKINDELLAQKSKPSVDFRPYGDKNRLVSASNVLGYFSWGGNGGWRGLYPTDGKIKFDGNSGWYIIQTAESFNGNSKAYVDWQGDYVQWFSENAFGGENYSNTPVAAVAHAGEPTLLGINDPVYFSCWENGQLFIDCAWMSKSVAMMTAIGDPWVRK